MKKTILLILLTFITKCFIAQNLVNNGNFETMNFCPNGFSQVTACASLYPAPNNTLTPYATDYLNACNAGQFNVPNSVWGFQAAHSGNGYMALATMAPQLMVDYRENIYTQLTTPLVVGTSYYVSMYVSFTDNSQNSTNNLGLKFAMGPNFPINNTAHVYTTTVITDAINWTLISGCFVADSAYQYIAVGNFFTDANTTSSVTCGGCIYNEHGYFIDDVSVIPNNALTISGSNTICAGATTILTASGASSYTWNTGATTDSIILNPMVTTTYTVIGEIGACPSQTAVATVNVAPPTSTVTISGSGTVCPGQNITLTANGATNYVWSTGATTASAVVNPTVTTTYTVTGGVGTCTVQAVATVTVVPGPILSIIGNTVICAGESTTLMASGANTYTWSTGATAANVAFNPNVNTTYTVMGTSGTCTAQVVSTVSVNPIPIVSITGNTVACAGNNTSLTASGANTYVWSNGATTATTNFNPSTTATYTVVGAIGACTNQQVITVTVVSNLTVLISGDSIICSGQQDILTASGAATYTWSTGVHTASIIITPTVSASYSVTGSVGTCFGTAVDMVVVKPSPIAVYTLNPNPATTLNPVVQFLNESVNYTHWAWNFGDGSPFDTSDVNPSHYYNTQVGNTYTTSLTLSNADGCISTDTVLLVIEPAFTFYIPNTFTPNGDGLNDDFKGEGIGISTFQIWVFDRWGENIYYSNDINKGWNGTRRGGNSTIVQEGLYVWTVTIEDALQVSHNYHGTVSLIK